MSQYGQQTQSNSEKRYVVGSMTTRKEIEQDAKDDVSQFNITFSEVRTLAAILTLFLHLHFILVLIFINRFSCGHLLGF